MSDDLVKRLNERLGSISTPEGFYGDNLAIVLCGAFEDDGEQNENGWTDAAIEGCDQTLQAIRNHYAPLADRIEELEIKLAEAEEALDFYAACDADNDQDRCRTEADAIAAWNTRHKPLSEQLFDQQISDYVKRGKP